MSTPTTPQPQQGQDDGQGEQRQGGADRPTLDELRQQSVALSEQIAQHLGRGSSHAPGMDADTPDPFASTPYEGSPAGWWTRYGGALDVRSGVVFIPPGADLPPWPFPCARCRARGKQ